MDEYLSKPLKQNLLMQTILRVASDGVTKILKEARTKSGLQKQISQGEGSAQETAVESSALMSPLRPAFAERSITTTGPVNHGSIESPSTATDGQADPISMVLNSVS